MTFQKIYAWGCNRCIKMCMVLTSSDVPPEVCPYSVQEPKFIEQKKK